METGLVVESGDGGERTLRVVNCTALGGRPQPEIAWRLPGEENTLSARVWSDDGVFISSVSLPAGGHEGENVTCVVSHPKLTRNARTTLTLPSYCECLFKCFSYFYSTHNFHDIHLEYQNCEQLIGLQCFTE